MTAGKREEDLARLFQAIGPRKQPDAAMEERVYAATLNAWEALPDRREEKQRKFDYRWVALAASVVLAAVLVVVDLATGSKPVGRVQYSLGLDMQPGTAIDADQLVRTTAGEYLNVRTGAGIAISIGPDTSLVFHDPSLISLQQGRIYIDAKEGQLRLLTPHMRVLDIGTIYQVHTDEEGTRVMMREGSVELAFANQKHRLSSAGGQGEYMQVDPKGEVKDQGELPTTDEVWSWRRAARPPLSLDGRTVDEFVTWLARDNGAVVQYDSALVVQQAALERLMAGQGQTTDTYSRDELLETTRFRLVEVDASTWLLQFRH